MIKFNNKEINDIFYQGKEITKVFHGEKIVYQKTPKKIDYSVLFRDITFDKNKSEDFDHGVTTITKLKVKPEFVDSFINLTTPNNIHERWGEHETVPADHL